MRGLEDPPDWETPFTCPGCGRDRNYYGYTLEGQPVCRGCWLDDIPADHLQDD